MHLDEIFKMTHPTQGELKTLGDIWQRAVPTESSKAASIAVNNTRKTGGDGTAYPSFAADKVMPSLKAFGATIQRKHKEALWGRYQPVNGITNANDTSIDTGIHFQNGIELSVRCKAISGSFYIFQARQTTTANIYGISGSQTGDTIGAIGLISDIARTPGNIYTLKLTVVDRAVTLYVKDETAGIEDTKTGTRTTSAYPFPSPTTIRLFGDASKVASGVTVYHASIKINGVPVWDIYPCADVANNNRPVAYDDVTRTGFTPTSGSITGGSLIQRVEYITPTQRGAWINTEHKPTDNVEIGMTYTPSETTDVFETLFGCQTSTTSNRFYCLVSATKYKLQFCDNRSLYFGVDSDGTTRAENGEISSYCEKTTVMLNRTNWSVKSEHYNASGSNISSGTKYSFTSDANPIGIGYRNLGTQTDTNMFTGEIHSAYIKESGILVRDYLPVRIGTVGYMLDTVEWKLYGNAGTGAFAYGEDTPEIYDLVCNKGVLEYVVGKNLFDKNATTRGKYLNSSGAEVINANWNISDYMPVEAGETYFQALTVVGTAPRTCWYDANKNFISAVVQVVDNTQIAPANARYCRMCVLIQGTTHDPDIAMFYKGTTKIPYEPYFRGIRADGSHKVKITTLHSPWDNGCYDNGTLGEVCKCVDITVPNGEYTVKTNCIKESSHPDIATIFTTNGHFPVSFSTSANGVFVDAPRTVTVTGGVISIGVRYLSSIGYKTYPTKETYNADGVWIKIYNSSGEEIGDNITVDITDILPSATSYLDIQKSTNNVVKDWDIIWYDGTQTIPGSYISQTGDLTPNQIVAYALAASATSTDALTPISLSTKGEKSITAEAEIPVTVQATVLSK